MYTNNSIGQGEPYQLALQLYALKEVVGKEDNPDIIKMFDDLGFDGKELKDETSWCAAFVNWILKETGYRGTGKLNGRSFLDLEGEVEEPQLGDIAIFWRESPDSWKGHVGFYVTERNGYIYVLGGNQSNQVKVSGYPKGRLLSYRRPKRISL